MSAVIPLHTTAASSEASRKLVRWKEHEVVQIAGEIIRISKRQMKDPVDHRGYRRTIYDAQNVLSPDRRRGLDSIQATKSLEPFQEAVKRILDAQAAAGRAQAEQAARNQAEAAAQAERAAQEAQAAEQAATLAAAQQAARQDEQQARQQQTGNPMSQLHGTGPASPQGQAHQHKPVPNVNARPEADPMPPVGENLNPPARPFVPRQIEPELPPNFPTGSLDAMLQMAGDMIANTFADSIIRTLHARMAKELPKFALRAAAVSKTMPKILVIGPLPKQQPLLEDAVDGLVELKFVSSEEGAQMVNKRGKYCVGAILWSNFVNHSHQAAMQKLFSSENFRIVTGTNLETLKQAVEDIAIQIAH